MKRGSVLCFLLIMPLSVFCQSLTTPQKLDDIVWITEQYPPSNYLDEKTGVYKGYMIDILVEVWKRAGINKTTDDILLLPWARGMRMMQSDKAVCLFGMVITEDRQKEFHFVGPVSGSVIGIIARRDKNLAFRKIEDVNSYLTSKRKTIGVVRKDSGEALLLSQGGKEKLQYQVNSGRLIINMLGKDRLEMVAYGEIAAIAHMEELKIDPRDYEVVFTLKHGMEGFAFNQNVSRDNLKTLQQAFDVLKQEKRVSEIRREYVKEFGNIH